MAWYDTVIDQAAETWDTAVEATGSAVRQGLSAAVDDDGPEEVPGYYNTPQARLAGNGGYSPTPYNNQPTSAEAQGVSGWRQTKRLATSPVGLAVLGVGALALVAWASR